MISSYVIYYCRSYIIILYIKNKLFIISSHWGCLCWWFSHTADGHDLSGAALLNINVSPSLYGSAILADYICSDLKVRCSSQQF